MRNDYLIKMLQLLGTQVYSKINLSGEEYGGGREIVHDLDNNIYYLDDDATEEKEDLKRNNILYKVYDLDTLLDDLVAGNLANVNIEKLSDSDKKKILAKYEIMQPITKIIYTVHSDEDENNEGNISFTNKKEAKDYALTLGDAGWIEEIEQTIDSNEEIIDEQTIGYYYDIEEMEEK